MSKPIKIDKDKYLTDEEKTRFYFFCAVLIVLDLLAIVNFFRIFLY